MTLKSVMIQKKRNAMLPDPYQKQNGCLFLTSLEIEMKTLPMFCTSNASYYWTFPCRYFTIISNSLFNCNVYNMMKN